MRQHILTLVATIAVSGFTNAGEPLDHVPNDADVLMHFNVAKILASPIGKPFRDNLDPRLKNYLDGEKAKFGLSIDMVESITYVEKQEDFPRAYSYIVAFHKPYKPETVIAGVKETVR